MSQKDFNPPRRGKPRRIEAGGTRAREEQGSFPIDPNKPIDPTQPNNGL
ncbi:hypothetical protein IQ268_02765 [Oculatella sp. LEGE 06141]|nr:hypothetical protein [Oculatella sp. LEGE 06141]MBE9177498.1 hypothetical protein [Oculatella sp. LEGE 06141]